MLVKISKFRNGWKKFIGGKMFYSHAGMDMETFQLLAGAFEDRWANIKAKGGTWTDDEIEAAYQSVEVSRPDRADACAVQTAVPVVTLAPSLISEKSSRQYIHASIDEYVVQLKGSVPNQIGIDQYEKVAQHMERLKKLQPDGLVDQIEYADLVRLKNAIINGKKADGQPFAVATITTIMSCFKGFFNHLADSSNHNWQPPRGFDKALNVDRSKLSASRDDDDDDDLNADESETFNVDELVHLWKTASSRQKFVMLLGLFVGFTAMDIATLRKKMILIEGSEMYIWRKRQKTRHKQKYKTKWWIPPELALLIRGEMLRTTDDPSLNPKGLVVLTSEKLPLVHRGKNGDKAKTDNIALVWRPLVARAFDAGKSKKLSHKHLRKTAGRLIRYGVNGWKGTNLDVAQQLLAHAGKTVAEKDYLGLPDFSDLHDAQRRLYAHLSPLLFSSQPPKVKNSNVSNVA